MSLVSRAVLSAALLLGPGLATTVSAQDASDESAASQPITGHAIPCEKDKIKTFDCHNIELLSYLPRSAIGGSSGYDLWGWHDTATGREYAIIGGDATAFVDVTDPVNPKFLGTLPPHEGTSHDAQSVKVYKNHAFIAYETSVNGLQVFDLTQLRDVKGAPVVFKETAHYDNFDRAHTLIMNEETGFIYAAATLAGRETCSGGLHMIDVRTPTKPTFVGCHNNPSVGRGFVHDAQCVVYRGPDAKYKGREICINSGEAAVEVLDVTDKQHPKTISTFTYPNVGYTHQGWFTEDQKYFFLDDEGDEESVGHTRTIAFDMTDLGDPVVLSEFLNTTTDTDHNLYIRGHHMYQGNYGAGLRIIDIADPKKPKEAGYLSTGGSAWTTYPFFKDDVVAVSMSNGLFLARLLPR